MKLLHLLYSMIPLKFVKKPYFILPCYTLYVQYSVYRLEGFKV